MAKIIVNNSLPTTNIEKNKSNNSKTEKKFTIKTFLKNNQTEIISTSMLGAGGILLYLGFTKPGKTKIFNKYIDSKIQEMDKIVDEYIEFIEREIEPPFTNLSEFINLYKKSNTLNIQGQIKQLEETKSTNQLIKLEDKLFSELYSPKRKKIAGTNDMDRFFVEYNKIKQNIYRHALQNKYRVELNLNDYLRLPDNKYKMNPEQLEAAEIRLQTYKQMLTQYMNKTLENKFKKIKQDNFSPMAETINSYRHKTSKTKEQILLTSFETISQQLKTEKQYHPLYKVVKYNINEKDLNNSLEKLEIPKELKDSIEPNIFFNFVEKIDFSEIKNENFAKLFNSIPEEYNLKDLRYLIDRLRLHEIVMSNQSDQTELKSYKPIITKLKYISNVLEDYGRKMIVDLCSKNNLSTMTDEKLRATLHYINNYSSKIGYENFEHMNKSLGKLYPEYSKLILDDVAEKINSNPYSFFI